MLDFPPLYLKNLYLKNIRVFKGEYFIDLSDGNGKPAQWSVILGNNNTGKTTVLRAIADLQPKLMRQAKSVNLTIEEEILIPNHAFKHFANSADILIQHEYKKVETDSTEFEHHVECSLLFRTTELEYNIKESLYEAYNLNQLSENNSKIKQLRPRSDWGFNESSWQIVSNNAYLESLRFFGYGPSRRVSLATLQIGSEEEDTTIGLYRDVELLNVEEWLLQTDYAQKNGNSGAKWRLGQIKHVLFNSGILSDVSDLKFTTDKEFRSFVELQVKSDWIKLSELSYGYQSVIAWLMDLTKKMLDRYPSFDNPLHGPAIVLVDEIDLHLHPEWQRKIIKYLSDLFPNTQFIVTAHSPLIVQSAENVNLIMLEKDDETGSINVRQQFGSFQGWTVEEILRELMDMGEKTRSDRYLELMRQFEDGLLAEDYTNVKTAYEELDKILSPSSHQRKVLQIQMSSLIPA